MMKNIAIIGLLKDTNIGDAIICESVEYLCRTVAPQHNYKLIDLKGRTTETGITNFLLRASNFVFRKLKTQAFSKLLFKRFVNQNLKNIDLIIFAGGGIIECEHYLCNFYLKLITEYAENHNIKIAYNAVGFNGDYNEKIQGYKDLKQVVNSKNVVSVTVRENLTEMNNQYLNHKTATLVSDPAVWSAESYNIKRKMDSDVVGINVIRPDIFKEFGYEVSENDIISFLNGIVEHLNNNNQKWQLFTNGVKLDYDFGVRFLSQLNLQPSEQNIKAIPLTGRQFLTDIAEYRGIICFRMHASICSYSLGIPSIALLWNPKQKFFYNNIEHGNRCVELDYNRIDDIFELFIQSMKDGFNEEKVNVFRNLSKNSLYNLLYSDI